MSNVLFNKMVHTLKFESDGLFCTYTAPDDSPRNVRVWAVSSTKLHVEWDPPSTEDHQLTVTEYIVQYNEVGDNTTIQMTLDAETPDNRHSYDITNLNPYRYYIIIVHATNDAGDSPGSLPHTIRTLSDSESVWCCVWFIAWFYYVCSYSLT